MEHGLIINSESKYLIDASVIKEVIPNSKIIKIPQSNIQGLIFLRDNPIFILKNIFKTESKPKQIVVMEIGKFLFGLQIDEFINIIDTTDCKTIKHEEDLVSQVIFDKEQSMLELDLDYILKEML